MDFRWGMIADYMPLFIGGMQMTLGITVIAVVLGTVIGLLMGMARLAEAKYGWKRYVLRYLVRLPATLYVGDGYSLYIPDEDWDGPERRAASRQTPGSVPSTAMWRCLYPAMGI